MKIRHGIVLAILLCSFHTFQALFAATVSAPVAHQVIGFVQTQNMLTVDIDDSIFPFNMEDSDVARNLNHSIVTGLKIGSIFMNTNTDTFTLQISHDKLKKIDETTGLPAMSLSSTNSIDYRLDVFYNNENDFKSVYSEQDITIVATDMGSQSPYQIINKHMFVSMNEDSTYISQMEDGRYISNIIFTLTAN